MKKVIFFPFNGNAKEAVDCLTKEYQLIGFVDDSPNKWGLEYAGVNVHDRSFFEIHSDALVLAVPGSVLNFKEREKIIKTLNFPDERFTTIIHPDAKVSKFSTIGINTLIMSGVVITSNAIIGSNVCLLPNAIIHHDSNIGDFSIICSGVIVTGNCTIGSSCYIGSGSRIINGIIIGKLTLVGMGSNVLRSLPQESKVVGNPARFI